MFCFKVFSLGISFVVWVRARSLGFWFFVFLALASRLLTASWPGAYCLVWLLGFSVSLASWLFGLSAFWPPDFLRIVL